MKNYTIIILILTFIITTGWMMNKSFATTNEERIAYLEGQMELVNTTQELEPLAEEYQARMAIKEHNEDWSEHIANLKDVNEPF